MIASVSGEGLLCSFAELCSVAPSLGSGLAHDAASGVLDVVTSGVTDSANWLVGHVIDLIDRTTAVQLTSSWFPGRVAAMRNVLVLVVLPVLMAASAGAVLRQDPKRLLRIWAVGLPVALIAGVAGVQVASWGMAATDQMCEVVTGGGRQLAAGFSGVIVSTMTSGEPQFVQIVVAGLIIAGAVAVWLELIVRSAAIYVAVFFMPMALIGYIWPATAHMAKRAVELVVALILSKFVIVATLTLGLAAVQQGADGAVAGGAILLMAGFAPFSLLRLAPVVEVAAISHLEGQSRRPLRASASAATMAASAPAHPVTRLIMSAAGRQEAGPPSPAVVSAVPIPSRRPDFPVPPAAPSQVPPDA